MNVSLFKLLDPSKKEIGYRVLVDFHLFGRVFWVKQFEVNPQNITPTYMEPIYNMRKVK